MRTNNILRTSIAVAAVGVLLAGCSDDASGTDDTADERPSSSRPSPTDEASTEESPTEEAELPDGVLPLPEPDPGEEQATLAEGRYRIALSEDLAFDIDVPDGTSAHEDGLYLATEATIIKTEIAGEEYGVPRDPCTDQQIEPTGPTVDDLVRALRDMPVYEVSDPEPVELGGAEGTYLQAQIPRSYDASGCQDGQVQLPANGSTAVNAPPPYIGRWWVLDVDGTRVVVQQNCWGCSSDEIDSDTRPQSITFTPTS